jgi:hypothetical protein
MQMEGRGVVQKEGGSPSNWEKATPGKGKQKGMLMATKNKQGGIGKLVVIMGDTKISSRIEVSNLR